MSDVEVLNLWGETVGASWHGTAGGYTNRKCRCEPCTKAATKDNRDRLNRNNQSITGDETWHGTSRGYKTFGCRCEACKEWSHHHYISKRYNLSADRIKSLLNRARCKICGTSDPGKGNWNVDHDHSCCGSGSSCGMCVREILCGRCNRLIGLAQDDPEILKSAAAYIELHAA